MIKKLLITCILILSLLGVTSAATLTGGSTIGCKVGPVLGPELVTNGGMEADSDWPSTGSPDTNERSNVKAYGGTYSRHIVVPISGTGGIQQYFSKTIGEIYYSEFWYYLESGTLIVRFINGIGDSIFAQAFTTTGSWQYYYFQSTEDAGGSGGGIMFKNPSGEGPAEFYIDDVSVKEVQ